MICSNIQSDTLKNYKAFVNKYDKSMTLNLFTKEYKSETKQMITQLSLFYY